MKAFLVTYNPWQAGQPALVAYLDTRREIKNWYTPYAGAALLVVEDARSASDITQIIRIGFPALQLAVWPVTDQHVDGWMPKQFWTLVNTPTSSGRWAPPSPLAGKTLAGLMRIGDKSKPPDRTK